MTRRQVAQRDDDRRLADDPILAVDHARRASTAPAGCRACGPSRRSPRRVFSAVFAAFFVCCPSRARLSSIAASIRSCSDRCAYQMSIVRISANSAIASRYARTDARVAPRASALLKPLLRAAIVKLAAMRLTSYSNGPGKRLVEVVEVEQQRPLGRGEHAEVRQVGIAAQLDGQTGPRRVLQVGGHDLGRAAIERERARPSCARGAPEPGRARGSRSAPRAARPGSGRSAAGVHPACSEGATRSALLARAFVRRRSDARPWFHHRSTSLGLSVGGNDCRTTD